MRVPFIDLNFQHQSLKEELDEAIATVITETAFIKGRFVAKFEEDFAAYFDMPFCVGCANGTDALEIALKSLDIRPDDEVIVPANTWISTAEAVSSLGAKVVFADIEENYYCMSPISLESKITPKTKAVIPVHLYGQACDMQSIMRIAKKHSLFVIEDCAQSHGGKYQGQQLGTFGDIATFSFFPSKNLGAFGDAGAVITKSPELATFCRRYSDHGRVEKDDHVFEGRNSRLDGLQAAILSVKLKYLDNWLKDRNRTAEHYSRSLSSFCSVPIIRAETTHAFHLYVVLLKERDQARKFLIERDIMPGIHYRVPLPFLKAYERLGHKPTDFPNLTMVKDNILSLPFYPGISVEQVEYVIESLCAFSQNN